MKATPDTMEVREILDLRRSQMLIVNSEYQRGPVWKSEQKKRLIDSVLRGYPLPLIYLHLIKQQAGGLKSERYEVIDGQQRINSLWDFSEGAFRLFDPVENAAEARFPEFIKDQPCPWGGKGWDDLSEELKEEFFKCRLPVVRIETHDGNEARDLFVRLQAGMPLNAQEKRDAWPGQFTEFILKLGGKPNISKYPGHDLFNVLMKANMTRDRGKYRQLAAQIAMLFFTRRETNGERLCDISSSSIDDFYYEHLAFDANSVDAKRLGSVFDKIVYIFSDRKRSKVQGHEAIGLVLLVDSLMDTYVKSWEDSLEDAFDKSRTRMAKATKTANDLQPDEYWLRYGRHTRTNSDRAQTIRTRHEFFVSEMFRMMEPKPKDPQRIFGPIEREIIYARDRKQCQVCNGEVVWDEADFHHVEAHNDGGRTTIDNGALVHRECHPKGAVAVAEFARRWRSRQEPTS